MNIIIITIFSLFFSILIFLIIRSKIRTEYPWTFKKRIKHPKFGLLWYNKANSDEVNGNYQGHYYFPPAIKNIDFRITSDKGNLNESGLSFLTRLESKFPKLEKEIYLEISKLYKINSIEIKNLGQLEIINIGKIKNHIQQWKVIYWINKPLSKSVMIEMENFKVRNKNNS